MTANERPRLHDSLRFHALSAPPANVMVTATTLSPFAVKLDWTPVATPSSLAGYTIAVVEGPGPRRAIPRLRSSTSARRPRARSRACWARRSIPHHLQQCDG